MENSIGTALIADAAHVYRQQRKLAEGAAQQVNDDQFFETDGPEANSIAIIMKHVGGNLRSRWTDFMNSDGEKPDRNRDGEFVAEQDTRSSIMGTWNEGWQQLEQTLAALEADSLDHMVTIRNEPCTVLQALMRSLAHTSHHCGQIVHIAKSRAGSNWKTLSIPRAGSRNATGNFWTAPK
jgi:hypothetical protein